MKMLFHHGEAESGVVGDLLITRAIANQSRDVLLSSRQADHVGQLFPAPCRMKVFALDEETRSRYPGGANLLKTDCGA